MIIRLLSYINNHVLYGHNFNIRHFVETEKQISFKRKMLKLMGY